MKSIIAAVLVLAGSGALFAAELQGFQGIRFGMKVSEGKFTGPDEDGDYSFVPEGRKPDPAISYFVSVTKKTKRIYSVVISHEVPAEQAAAYLQAYVKTIGDAYGKVGRHVKPQTEEWNNFYEAASATADGVLKNSYNVWLFEDSKGAVCQVVQMFLLKGEESFTLNVSAVDQKLSDLDDTETSGGAGEDAASGKGEKAEQQDKVPVASQSANGNAPELKSFYGFDFGKKLGNVMFRNETGNEYPGGRTCLDTPRRFLSYEKRAEVFTTPNDDEIYCVCLHSEVMAEEKCKELVKETLSVIQKNMASRLRRQKRRVSLAIRQRPYMSSNSRMQRLELCTLTWEALAVE